MDWFLYDRGLRHKRVNVVLTNRDEVIQQYFKSGLSSNETLSVLSANHNVSLSIVLLERILKKLGLYWRTPRISLNDVLAIAINESSCRYLWYKVMHQNLLMNGFLIDRESVRLILKELDSLDVEQRVRIVWLDVATSLPVPTMGLATHGVIDSYSRKILLWLFVGSSNNDPKVIAYYFINCVVELQLVILQLCDFRSIILQDFLIICKNSSEHLIAIWNMLWCKITKHKIYSCSNRHVYQSANSSIKLTVAQPSIQQLC